MNVVHFISFYNFIVLYLHHVFCKQILDRELLLQELHSGKKEIGFLASLEIMLLLMNGCYFLTFRMLKNNYRQC